MVDFSKYGSTSTALKIGSVDFSKYGTAVAPSSGIRAQPQQSLSQKIFSSLAAPQRSAQEPSTSVAENFQLPRVPSFETPAPETITGIGDVALAGVRPVANLVPSLANKILTGVESAVKIPEAAVGLAKEGGLKGFGEFGKVLFESLTKPVGTLAKAELGLVQKGVEAITGKKAQGKAFEENRQAVEAVNKIISNPIDAFQHLTEGIYSLSQESPEVLPSILQGIGQALNKNGIKEIQTPFGKVKTQDVISSIGSSAIEMAKQGTTQLYNALTTQSPEKFNAYVQEKFTKGVRPTVVGQRTEAQIRKYQDNTVKALETIVKNKDQIKIIDEFGETTGKLPQNLREFNQGIEQGKKLIYNKYNELAKASGEKGGQVNLNSIADELDNIANDPVIKDLDPSVASYASSRAQALRARGMYDVETGQRAIEALNADLQSFYKNPTFKDANAAAVDALIANKLRTGLDDVITSTEGVGYRQLRSQYGALKTIEKDVAHRMIIDARKNYKGLVDYSDIFSAGDVVRGITSLDPGSFVAGIAQKTIASYFKHLNNPNRAIKQLFEAADDFYSPNTPIELNAGLSTKNVSKTGALKEGAIQNAVKNIGKEDIITARQFIDTVDSGKLDFRVLESFDDLSTHMKPHLGADFKFFSLKEQAKIMRQILHEKSVANATTPVVDRSVRAEAGKFAGSTSNTMSVSEIKYPASSANTAKVDSFVSQAIKDGVISLRETSEASPSLVDFIRKNGVNSVPPIVVDSSGRIIDGVHRFDAFKELGIKKIPVIKK